MVVRLGWRGEGWKNQQRFRVGPVPHNFHTTRRQQARIGGVEWESPKAGTILFPPPLEDGVPIGMDDGYLRLGEDDPAAKIGKWPQAYEGVGEGGHHMSLHRCRWK